MAALRQTSWSPYLVGLLIGVLSWLAFLTADRALGITTAFEYSAALLVQGAAPAVADGSAYFADPDKDPKIDWEWMLVVGVFVGAWISAAMSGDRSHPPVPALWRRRFGDGVGRRYGAAFAGGALMMLGARLAQGCTSGHGISGTLQLAVSSWIFLAVFASTSVAVAWLLYARGGRDV